MKALLAAGLVLVSASALSQWQQEPTSVMGIELGGTQQSIPKCPPGNAALLSQTTCVELSSIEPKIGTLWGLPVKFVLGGGDVFFVDQRVAQIAIKVRHSDDYARLRQILIERYGQPHKVESLVVTANSGAVVTSEETSWSGDRVFILLSERSDRIDRSQASFVFRPLMRRSNGYSRDAVKGEAAKF